MFRLFPGTPGWRSGWAGEVPGEAEQESGEGGGLQLRSQQPGTPRRTRGEGSVPDQPPSGIPGILYPMVNTVQPRNQLLLV